MKKADFDQAVDETPKVMARFELLKAQHGHYATDHEYHKGEKFLYHPNGCMMPEEGNKFSLHPSCTKFKFVGYVLVERRNNKVIGEFTPKSLDYLLNV